LQGLISNNAAALSVGQAQHSFIPTETGGAIDDSYLYCFKESEYLFVVNAANKDKDWTFLQQHLRPGDDVSMTDLTEELAMISLQGPLSETIMESLLESGSLPEMRRNRLSIGTIAGTEVFICRTGYTGEPLCFELIMASGRATQLWDLLMERGAVPVGLGARDTLRLEAGLPLFGQELGIGPDGKEIPVFSSHLSAWSVSFAPEKGDYIGKSALLRQKAVRQQMDGGDFSHSAELPVICRPVVLTDRGIARAGSRVFKAGQDVGWISSGTAVPYSKATGADPQQATSEYGLRSICLALLRSDIGPGDELTVDVRGKSIRARVVTRHLDSSTPPCARPVIYPAT
jgi:aminomethyltransferase